MQIFFTSGIGHGVLINVLEDSIIFLIWAAWILFDFYLKQKQGFSVWSFTENDFFIPFHGGIWGRYSELNKFKIRKYLFFQE